ncbi:hypothetical protein BCR33DRAFT_710888 [Rhizoclosmatium globosum]|uniref:Glycoside hydrolase n=1 Tax=Rhizoclosmatium globosum TaxID=329046 RepID=A0A1Y2D2N9_9FUNG|nr:hypothetical protein BCR33DRAFT_710888 [Rhizoclosmatium globosum]|eukprot:ORY53467.1 hypothetical protein BCR33DRAFT_710888 [Rhizoclosmatium globosum]
MHLSLAFVIAAAFNAISVLALFSSAQESTSLKLIVPAYFDSHSLNWVSVANKAKHSNVKSLIFSPSHGPGSTKDDSYAAVRAAVGYSNITVYGFVDTQSGKKALSDVQSELQLYIDWYKVDGIYLDNVSGVAADLSYYADVSNSIRKQLLKVVINPRKYPDEAYVTISDILVAYEGTLDNYATLNVPSWARTYKASKFAYIFYSAQGVSSLNDAKTIAASNNVGNLYVTDGDNSYNTLPTYFDIESPPSQSSPLIYAKSKAVVAASPSYNVTVPAFFYPNGSWTEAINQSKHANVRTLIITPWLPGGKDAVYVQYIQQARANGIKVLGLVDTGYGARALTAVKADIGLYNQYYTIDGFYLASAAIDNANLAYYQSLSSYIKGLPQNQIYLGAGSYPLVEGYMAVADVVLAFSNTFAAYQTLVVPAWASKYSPSQFAHFVYSTPASQLNTALGLVATNRAGNVYITDFDGSFTTLPSYFNLESPAAPASSTTTTTTTTTTTKPTPTPVDPKTLSVVIPAYFYPGSIWDDAINTTKHSTVKTLIMNPGSGPGTSLDPVYAAYVNKTQKAGIKVLGYTATTYHAKNISTVRAEIDAYYKWYNVDGIFLDEASSDDASLSYYQNVSSYIRSKQGRGNYIVVNPGVYPTEGYINVADLILSAETTFAKYSSLVIPSWVSKYASSRFYHIVHTAPTVANLNTALAYAASYNVKNVYVTEKPGSLPTDNPYNSTPIYFNVESPPA